MGHERLSPWKRPGRAAQMTGDIAQVPPMVSALKVGGRRLHELARAGLEVERPARPVNVTRFDVALAGVEQTGPVLAIDVECSSGTYVRSLAADLGTSLGGGAHLRSLRRLSVGEFTLEDAVTLDELEASPEPSSAVLAPVEALRGMPRAVVGAAVAASCPRAGVSPACVERGGCHRGRAVGRRGR